MIFFTTGTVNFVTEWFIKFMETFCLSIAEFWTRPLFNFLNPQHLFYQKEISLFCDITVFLQLQIIVGGLLRTKKYSRITNISLLLYLCVNLDSATTDLHKLECKNTNFNDSKCTLANIVIDTRTVLLIKLKEKIYNKENKVANNGNMPEPVFLTVDNCQGIQTDASN